jgi:5-formyltetrahydrofolate cyclo-ligase
VDTPANGRGGPATARTDVSPILPLPAGDLPATADKPALRRLARERRRSFVTALNPDARKEMEQALAATIARHVPAVGVWAAYHATGHEIDPAHAAAEAARLGALVCHPWFVDREAAMEFRLDCGHPAPGPFGAPQPSANQAAVEPDVILVPLLAVDRRGIRLGQGGGHYDRALARLRASKRVLAIGLAWPVQLWDACPAEPWDQPLDAIAVPDRWIPTDR